MNPQRLKLRNVRTFRELDVELPQGCVAVVGVNGAGKSTFTNAIDWALFGPDGRSWQPYLAAGGEATELQVELVFDHAEATWRIRRGYSARGAGKTTLDLERWKDAPEHSGDDTGPQWEPVTLEGQRATQAHVEAILGLSRETFRASAFLAQGDGGAWTEAPASKRKEILAKILGLDRFEKPLSLVKADRKLAENSIAKLTGALERADVELTERATVEELLKTAQAVVADAERDEAVLAGKVEGAARKFAGLEAQAKARTDAEAALARADAVLAPLLQRAEQAEKATAELAAAEAALATLATPEQAAQAEAAVTAAEAALTAYREQAAAVEQARRDAQAKTAQRDAILAQAEAKAAEAQRLDEQTAAVAAGDLSDCPVCEQELGAAAREATLGNLRARADVATSESLLLLEQRDGIEIPEVPPEPEPPLQAQQQLADARKALAAAQDDQLRRERLSGRIEQLRSSVAYAPPEEQVAAARTEAAAATSALDRCPAPDAGAVAAAQAAAVQAKTALDQARARGEQARTDEARVQAKIERLDELAKATAADRFERERHQRLVDRLLILERAFGRDGIPALIVQGAAIPAIEAEAARILDELGTSYRVELRTEKALKDGTPADALDIVVITETGERDYSTFSGGERTRINLALRIALAQLLAGRRGADSQILAIDEPDGLDEAGMAGLVRVLSGLNGTFSKTYVISHVPDLRSAFDTSLEVVKGDDGLSRVAA